MSRVGLPPVAAQVDVRSRVLDAKPNTKVPVAPPIVLHNPGSAFSAVLNVAPLTSWTLQDSGERKGTKLDAWA
jgi:hypothetical protein